jgi:hypothetical protein
MFQDFAELPGGETLDLSKPSVKGLAFLLRHPDKQPVGFVFRYSSCDQCAMGLARAQWAAERVLWSPVQDTAELLGISHGAASRLFMTRGFCFGVTAEEIAADLDELVTAG